MRYNFERNIMNNKLMMLGLCLCLIVLNGCVNNGKSQLAAECRDGICTSEQEYKEVCTQTPEGFSVCEEVPEVMDGINYTRTQADFRNYGERSPRDYRITQAGAGNNISATIPPSIDSEVVDYEAEIMQRESNAQNPTGANPTIQETVVMPDGVTVVTQTTTMAPQGMVAQTNTQEVILTETTETTATESKEEDTSKDWLAEEGQNLKELLTQWSEESGWRLIWKTNRNYTLSAGAMFRGNFADVASALIRAFARARPAPIATFYKGNRVLVIETMEDENAYD